MVRYLLTLPARMVAAALAVPLKDLDDALALSEAADYLGTFADDFALVAERKGAVTHIHPVSLHEQQAALAEVGHP